MHEPSLIRGYAARPSVHPGGTLVLHVATRAPRFRVAFHRWGAQGYVAMGAPSAWLPGADAPDGRPEDDWQWPAHPFDVPRDWPSGVYVAHLVTDAPQPLQVWMDQAAALFVVRGPGRSPILYKLPLATWQAYNDAGGGCLYHRPPWSAAPPGGKVSWRRPGGAIGGPVFGAPDHYDSASPRQTFAHWDAPFLRWLLGQGHEPEYCTDLDVHREPALLQRHRLLLTVGHDEYWTMAMREHIEAHVRQGGNAAWFGANLCWWRIHLVDDDGAMVCHQGGKAGAYDHWWPETGVHRPEDALTGVSYRHGGGWWDGPRESEGYVVQQPGHWVFAGTGLQLGDRFGASSTPPLAGYECDGAPLVWTDPARRLAALDPRAAQCGTPAGFQPLAVAPLNARWQELPHREHHAFGAGLHNAALGLHCPGGTVFTAGTTDWAQVLANGSDPHVARITRNVIERLAR